MLCDNISLLSLWVQSSRCTQGKQQSLQKYSWCTCQRLHLIHDCLMAYAKWVWLQSSFHWASVTISGTQWHLVFIVLLAGTSYPRPCMECARGTVVFQPQICAEVGWYSEAFCYYSWLTVLLKTDGRVCVFKMLIQHLSPQQNPVLSLSNSSQTNLLLMRGVCSQRLNSKALPQCWD